MSQMDLILILAAVLFVLSALCEFVPRLKTTGHACWLVWAAIFVLVFGSRWLIGN